MSSDSTIKQEKAAARQKVEAALKGLSSAGREAASAKLRAVMEREPVWRNARSLLGFAPMPGEIDIWPLVVDALTQGKSVALPRYDRQLRSYAVCGISNMETDVAQGYYGIREPAAHCVKPDSNVLDIILVPGVAFDTTGRRLGRGKGFYDRLLGAWRGVTCGVCYDEQLIERVPVEPHDVQMDCILTPTGFFHPGRS